MKFDGTNLEQVLQAHAHWVQTEGEHDEERADFSDLNLCYIDLSYKNLWGANFRNSFLYKANLYCTKLDCADFTNANLKDANLAFTSLDGAKNLPDIPLLCPDTGSFIGWKRVYKIDHNNDYSDSLIAKLLIPEDALRSSNTNKECRASKVKVLEIQTLDGEVLEKTAGVSIFDKKTLYIPGEIIETDFGVERFNLKSHGIYFYINRMDAVDYLTFGNDYNGNKILIDKNDFVEFLESHNKWEESL